MAAANVLIIDDNAIVLQAIVNLVEDLGFSTTGVRSAEDATPYLKHGTFDILLCDKNLGAGQSGAAFLSGDPAALPATLVLMSGGPRPATLPARVNYLGKPFTIAQLNDILTSAI